MPGYWSSLLNTQGTSWKKGITWDCKSRSQGVECRGETVPRHDRGLSCNPDLASCCVLVWNRLLPRPDQASNRPPGSTHVLLPTTILTALSCMILWHLSSSTEIHFVLQLPNTCLVYKFPLTDSITRRCSVPSIYRADFQSWSLSLGLWVLTTAYTQNFL